MFIGGSFVWDFSRACLIARHRYIKKIVEGWTVKTRKKRKKVCSEHKKAPWLKEPEGEMLKGRFLLFFVLTQNSLTSRNQVMENQ